MIFEPTFVNNRLRDVFLRESFSSYESYSYDNNVYSVDPYFLVKLSDKKLTFDGEDTRILKVKDLCAQFEPKEKEFTFHLKCRISRNHTGVLSEGISKIGNYFISVYKLDERHHSNFWHWCDIIFKVTGYDEAEAIFNGEKEGVKITPVLSVILNRCISIDSDGIWGAGQTRRTSTATLDHNGFANYAELDSKELNQYLHLSAENKTRFEKACRGYQMFLEVARKYPVLGGVCLRSVFDILYGPSRAKIRLKEFEGKLYSDLSYYPHNDIMPEQFLDKQNIQFVAAHREEVHNKQSHRFYSFLHQVSELARKDLLNYLKLDRN